MKIIQIAVALLLLLLIIWIDLPENLRIGKFQIQRYFKTHLGLDLQGGSSLVFQADTTKVKASDLQDALNSSRDIIERRVNFFGVSEPTVQTLQVGNTYRISVDLPGFGNVEEAARLIGTTAQLTFKEEASPSAQVSTLSALLVNFSKDTGLTGKDIQKASVTFDPQTGKPQVALQFSDAGKKLFADITTRNVSKPVGIFLDNGLLSAPVVQQPILDGNAVITGNFTTNDANKLAIAINSGALPLPIHLIEQRNIGPTLGASEVRKSIYAGAVGLLMVLTFMIIYYGRLGLIASLALAIYGLISFAIFRAVPIVLTLPGVAGFILSIGMAVDSNILIFERIKEERRKGRDLDIAIRLGFGRALDAIKDANITTLLVAFILFNPLNWGFLPQFGMVRGFALTLAIGVATSLFTGVVITRRLINILYKHD